jgi:hypothetical protein
MEILMKKYPPTTSSIECPNIDNLYSGYLASQTWRARMMI